MFPIPVSLCSLCGSLPLAFGGRTVIETASYHAALWLVGFAASYAEYLPVQRLCCQRDLYREFTEQIRAGPGNPAGQIVNHWLDPPQL